MEEQLVSYETAVLAKEKGFDEQCLCCFNRIGELYEANLKDLDDIYNISFPIKNTTIDSASNESWRFKNGFTATTQSLLQKWLRDEKSLLISISYHPDSDSWYYWISDKTNDPYGKGNESDFETFEDALESALKESLNLL